MTERETLNKLSEDVGDDHYAQASVYSMIGIERLRELYYGDGQYGFNSNFIDLQYGTEPTPPDIYSGRLGL